MENDKELLKEKTPKIFECKDCHSPNPPIFMVRDEIWYSIFPKYKSGIFCVRCFENYLGRKLTIYDLGPNIVNEPIRLGYELAQREFDYLSEN